MAMRMIMRSSSPGSSISSVDEVWSKILDRGP
jgi:hypothetical protein